MATTSVWDEIELSIHIIDKDAFMNNIEKYCDEICAHIRRKMIFNETKAPMSYGYCIYSQELVEGTEDLTLADNYIIFKNLCKETGSLEERIEKILKKDDGKMGLYLYKLQQMYFSLFELEDYVTDVRSFKDNEDWKVIVENHKKKVV